MIRGAIDTLGRGAALIVTNRRWGATLSAAALGFGIFAGVAIGPGASGSLAGGAPQLIALAPPAAEGEGEGGAEFDGSSESSGGFGSSFGASGGETESFEAFPSAAPLAGGSAEPLPVAEEGPAAEPKAPPSAEEEGPEATALAGTVAHVNKAAGSYSLAIKGGELVPVHASKLPQAGSKLSVEAVQLANGTFAEEGERERKGAAKVASVRGVVTDVNEDPAAPAYTLSGRGASLLVRVEPDPTGAMPELPPRGAYATVEASIEPGADLAQRKIELEPGEPSTYLDLAGIYAGPDPETGQLLLSSDDTRAGKRDLQLTVPARIKTTKLEAGDSYLATAEIKPDGTLELAGIASDEQRKGADDDDSAQGDLKR